MSEILVVKLGGTTIQEQSQVLDEVATVARPLTATGKSTVCARPTSQA